MHFSHPDLRVLHSWDRLTFNVMHLQHLMREGVSTYQGSCIRSYLLVMTFFCTCVLLLITFLYTWVLLLFFFFILQTFFYTWVLLTPSLTYRPLAFIWPFFYTWAFTCHSAFSFTWALDRFLLLLPPKLHRRASHFIDIRIRLNIFVSVSVVSHLRHYENSAYGCT